MVDLLAAAAASEEAVLRKHNRAKIGHGPDEKNTVSQSELKKMTSTLTISLREKESGS